MWTYGMRLLVWLLVAVVGLVVGLGGYTFYQAKGYSYLSDDPAACVNCHVMREQYEGWHHSNHRNWAVCNDCHLPHDSELSKWYTKALNGWLHSVKFTTGGFPEPITLTERNRRIVVESCLYCHKPVVEAILINAPTRHPDDLRCLSCHKNMGH